MRATNGNADCSGPTGTPIFHLHPLLRCNLRCLHCYSSSAPDDSAIIPAASARAAIDMAAAWGYQVLAISGGEPTLYPQLRSLLERAGRHGMRTSIVTNGLLLDRRGVLDCLRLADTVCVSIDGLAVNHDRMRARQGAFQAMQRTVRTLVDTGLAVWLSCGVTSANLDEVEEITATAHAWGARGINFHPVERAGRAATLADTLYLTSEERFILYAATHLLAQAYAGSFDVTVDLLHTESIVSQPALIYAADDGNGELDRDPARALGVLVMETDGTLSPVCHGFSRQLSIGTFAFNQPNQAEMMWEDFRRDRYPALCRLGRSLLAGMQAPGEAQVVNPSELLAAHALRLQAVRPVPALV